MISDDLSEAIAEIERYQRSFPKSYDGLRAEIGKVTAVTGEVFPAGSAVKETLGGRRKRLRQAVAALLGAAGWKMVKANVFEKLGAA